MCNVIQEISCAFVLCGKHGLHPSNLKLGCKTLLQSAAAVCNTLHPQFKFQAVVQSATRLRAAVTVLEHMCMHSSHT
jgi:hypothetical protein